MSNRQHRHSHHRRAALATTAALFAGAITLGTAVAAEASAAPSCISADVSNKNHDVTVTNNCTTRQRVKVIWAYAGDSACRVLGPSPSSGGSYAVTWNFDDHRDYPAHFDGLQSC